ncbi:MAG: hypothetical protein ACP5RD_01755 [bacterium]|jgi:hypothetical protein
MINSINNSYKLLLKDKTNNTYKLGDGLDDYRDLVSLEAKYDNPDNPSKINIKINFNKYDSNLYKEQESLVFLIDFINDEGRYLLPFNIRGATDHWWDIAFKINNFNKKIETISSLKPEEVSNSLTIDKIDEKEGSLYLTIDLNKLREYGFIDQLPLYIQVLNVKDEKDYRVITDSFNDPKPWENSNFLIGALPINLALKYSKSL